MSEAVAPTTPLDVRRFVESDESDVLALLEASLAGGPTGERSADFFQWKHRENPFGASPMVVAIDPDTGRMAGFRTWLRWRFRAGAEELRAVRAVDTATHPDYQGRGIFRTLTMRSLEWLADDTDLVFNTPNDRSRPGYLKMGWTQVGKLSLDLAPVRPLSMARHRADFHSGGGRPGVPECRLDAAQRALDDPRLGPLLDAAESAGPLDRLRTDRSIDYLQWRYRAPGLDYRCVVVEHAGDLAAVAFCRPRWRGALAELVVDDVFARPGDRAVLRRVLRGCRRAGTDYAVAVSPTGVKPADRLRALYLPARGAGQILTTRPFHAICPDPRVLDSWALTLGDLEVF